MANNTEHQQQFNHRQHERSESSNAISNERQISPSSTRESSESKSSLQAEKRGKSLSPTQETTEALVFFSEPDVAQPSIDYQNSKKFCGEMNDTSIMINQSVTNDKNIDLATLPASKLNINTKWNGHSNMQPEPQLTIRMSRSKTDKENEPNNYRPIESKLENEIVAKNVKDTKPILEHRFFRIRDNVHGPPAIPGSGRNGKKMDHPYSSVNNMPSQSSGIKKKSSLQYWCHATTVFSIIYVIISTLFFIGTTVGLVTYQYTYGNMLQQRDTLQIYYKIISKAILLKPETIQNITSTLICEEANVTKAVNDSCATTFDSYFETWNLCILADKKKFRYGCWCCNQKEYEQRLQTRKDDIEACLVENDDIASTALLSKVIYYIESQNSSITTSDIYETEKYIRMQKKTIYEMREIVQLVSLLILATSFGLCIFTWFFQKCCFDNCCSLCSRRCLGTCCRKIALEDTESGTDQILIDKTISAKRNNRVHSNDPRATPAFEEENSSRVETVAKETILMTPKSGFVQAHHQNYLYKAGKETN